MAGMRREVARVTSQYHSAVAHGLTPLLIPTDLCPSQPCATALMVLTRDPCKPKQPMRYRAIVLTRYPAIHALPR